MTRQAPISKKANTVLHEEHDDLPRLQKNSDISIAIHK